ncbi:MAG: Tetratricopeptide repeat [Acidobacteriota bacterium]|jgi:hypothetical protein|nr:Tetratricopeptide repeat [Acidobacteriota bacterium]
MKIILTSICIVLFACGGVVAAQSGTQSVKQEGAANSQPDLEEAEPFLQRALELREKAVGADSPATVPAFLNLTDGHFLNRDFGGALKLLERAVTILAAQPPKKDQATADHLKRYLCVTASQEGGSERALHPPVR